MSQQSNIMMSTGLEKPANRGFTEVRVRGKATQARSIEIGDRTVIVRGKWLKMASIYEEKTVEGEIVSDPELFIREIRGSKLGVDVFTFPQRFTQPERKYSYPYEWDNVAVLPITTYDEWLAKKAQTDVRQNVKKSAKRGVVARVVPFDDQLVRGIMEIYNESPIRQGRPFWHYGKDFETVKKETSHCVERSVFVGAYFQDELIGFIKLLFTGPAADLVLIVSKQSHFDKKPTNALIAKAVEVCAERKTPYLMYAKFVYGNKASSSLVDFKRRNGFEAMKFPRYFVPLTLKGKLAVKTKAYRDFKEVLPERLVNAALSARSKFYARRG
jgi:hypothetical protein